MDGTLISVIGTHGGTLAGTALGYYLPTYENEKNFRRTVLRDIAFEYRAIGRTGGSADVDGLLRAGICQCQTDEEYVYVIELIGDLYPEFNLHTFWRPNNGRYLEFFALLRKNGVDPLNRQALEALRREVEGGSVG